MEKVGNTPDAIETMHGLYVILAREIKNDVSFVGNQPAFYKKSYKVDMSMKQCIGDITVPELRQYTGINDVEKVF